MTNAITKSSGKRRGPTAAPPRTSDLFEDAGIEVERCDRPATPVADDRVSRPRANGETDGPRRDVKPELDL